MISYTEIPTKARFIIVVRVDKSFHLLCLKLHIQIMAFNFVIQPNNLTALRRLNNVILFHKASSKLK